VSAIHSTVNQVCAKPRRNTHRFRFPPNNTKTPSKLPSPEGIMPLRALFDMSNTSTIPPRLPNSFGMDPWMLLLEMLRTFNSGKSGGISPLQKNDHS
jgi:hypothetical protein